MGYVVCAMVELGINDIDDAAAKAGQLGIPFSAASMDEIVESVNNLYAALTGIVAACNACCWE